MANEHVPAAVSDEISAVKQMHADLKNELRQATGADLRDQLSAIHSCLGTLVRGKVAGDSAAQQSVRLTELMDAICTLSPLKDRLPPRLYTRLWAQAYEMRQRFHDRGFDGYACRETLALAARVRRAMR